MSKFDLSKLTEKLDMQTIIDNVKSVINPGSVIPDEGDGDPVVTAFVELHKSMKNIAETQAQQAQEISKLNNMLAALYNKLKDDKVINFGLDENDEVEVKAEPAKEAAPAEKESTPAEESKSSDKPAATEDEKPKSDG